MKAFRFHRNNRNIRPARFRARVLFAGLLCLALPGCDKWIGTPAADVSDAAAWTVLPMHSFVSRPSIDVVGMQLCTRAQCGYDAAIERFIASGTDADELEKQLTQPQRLARLIGKTDPKSKTPAPKVAVDKFAQGSWSGIRVTIGGGARNHPVTGYAVSRPSQAGAMFIVVIAGQAPVAARLIAQAAQ